MYGISFALTTGNELTDFAYMENGFKLEMAKSRYLTIDIVWSAVRKVNNRYAFDARVNTATQEGREYTAVGIYSFTVKNPVTGDTTIKTIYVGDDPIYKAPANGKTIDAINDILAQRSEFKEDGLVYFGKRRSIQIIIKRIGNQRCAIRIGYKC